ncbi:MAG: phosphoglucosamine mutase, partial [Candidatus Krumholzibacteria bacterium]|nr:phosphoglucosamine mutase [Candidatus Krumholzibacteria bacterium]
SVTERGVNLDEIVSAMPDYHIVKEKVAFSGSLPDAYDRLEREFKGRADLTDGLRIDMEAGWLHVRPSNTEPVVRIIAEAESAALAEELTRRANETIGSTG